MTKPSEVNVSNAEGLTGCRMLDLPDHKLPMVKRMLAVFLAPRVPDALGGAGPLMSWEASHNNIRDAVLRGPQK